MFKTFQSQEDCLPVSLSLRHLDKPLKRHLLDDPGFVWVNSKGASLKERLDFLGHAHPPSLGAVLAIIAEPDLNLPETPVYMSHPSSRKERGP